jgi:hypothetical protein
MAASSEATPILIEDFESGVLDPRISVQRVGAFGTPAGIQNVTDFGSSKAFGFGLSTCPASCFFNFVNTLHITLSQATFVTTISFDEKEKFNNWGSDGSVFINGNPLGNGFRDFGRLPYNDLQGDTAFRSHVFDINQLVSTIDLRVADITNLSEIFLDNLVVNSGQEPAVPELSGLAIVLVALFGVWGATRVFRLRSFAARPA